MKNIDYEHSKVPGPESGIEIRHSMCDVCSPGMHCGLNVYVKDGKILKVEGMRTTLNHGCRTLASCVLANSKGAVIGDLSTPIEVGKLEDALALY